MLRAIISDIHSNVEALDAVLADIARRKVERIVCLGDVIGYGPQPRDTLKRVKDWEVTLLGNHEEACMYHPEDFNERARIALEWTREQLNLKSAPPDENYALWALIGAMPTSHQIDNALLVHGSPRDPVREYMLPRDAQDLPKMREVFDRMKSDFCFVGHSHVPGVYTEQPAFLTPSRFPDGYRRTQGKALVNVGSVGQPRDGDTRASYATFDGETVWFHRVEYDFQTTQKKIIDTGVLPRFLAARLQEGR